MSEYARSGIIMLGLVTAMCGAVIVLTEPLRCRKEELTLLYELDRRGRTVV